MRDLKCILVSEKTQSGKGTYCLIPTYIKYRKRQNYKDSNIVEI